MAKPQKITTKVGAISDVEDPQGPLSSYIQPLVKVNGEDHYLEKQAKSGEEMPIMKAVGVYRADMTRNHSWVSYVVTIQGDKVLKIEVAEPDMRAIAEESAKIEFVSNFMEREM